MSTPFPVTADDLSNALAASIAKTQTPKAQALTAWMSSRRDDLAHEIAHSKNSDLTDFGTREIIDIAHHVGVSGHGTRAAILNRIRAHVLAAENPTTP